MTFLCAVHAFIVLLALALSSANCMSNGPDLKSEACYDPVPVEPVHATLQSARELEDIESLLQSSTSLSVARDALATSRHSNKANTEYEHTTSLILRMCKSSFSVGSIILCVLILVMCMLIVLRQKGFWREATTAKPELEAEIRSKSDAHLHCHGFSTAFDWMCADSGQALVGKRDVLMQEQRQTRCLILTAAVIGAIAILILTLWASHRSGSLVLIGDGVHLFSDVVTYSVLLFAEVASSSWKGDVATYSFGYGRAEVIISFLAISAQYVAMIRLLWSALERLQFPHQLADHAAETIILVGIASVIMNTGIGAWMHLKGICLAHDHSTEGGSAAAYAKVHLLCDAAQNLIVLITGLLVLWRPQLVIAEPICTLVFCACFFYGTAGFLVQLIDILMERAPRNIDCESVHAELCKIKGVEDVHCLHVWKLAPGQISAIAHLCTADSKINEDVLRQAQMLFQHHYAIKHCTIQVTDSDDLVEIA
mmetsp:Transcript_26751/g.43991  ORF Transcript_26751/g.43991 Transcript_26751/m.43991 type:complete len:482 (-) Transcript_26751:57-1502(-)